MYIPSALEWIFWKCSELISKEAVSMVIAQPSISVSTYRD